MKSRKVAAVQEEEGLSLESQEEAEQLDAARVEKKQLAAYMDVPTCVACAARSCVPAASFCADVIGITKDDRALKCLSCGYVFTGTSEQIAQAHRAEVAWNTRTDNRIGPWSKVLLTRRRRTDPRQERLLR